jgi:hypothetical protein
MTGRGPGTAGGYWTAWIRDFRSRLGGGMGRGLGAGPVEAGLGRG